MWCKCIRMCLLVIEYQQHPIKPVLVQLLCTEGDQLTLTMNLHYCLTQRLQVSLGHFSSCPPSPLASSKSPRTTCQSSLRPAAWIFGASGTAQNVIVSRPRRHCVDIQSLNNYTMLTSKQVIVANNRVLLSINSGEWVFLSSGWPFFTYPVRCTQ